MSAGGRLLEDIAERQMLVRGRQNLFHLLADGIRGCDGSSLQLASNIRRLGPADVSSQKDRDLEFDELGSDVCVLTTLLQRTPRPVR